MNAQKKEFELSDLLAAQDDRTRKEIPANLTQNPPKFMACTETMWPSYGQIAVIAIVSAVAIILEICFSRRIGLLTMFPSWDGVNYMSGAKFVYLTVRSLFHHPHLMVRHLKANWQLLHSPLWVAVISLNYFIFGEGEWQSYTARFWPTLMLTLLIFWALRRRFGSQVAWCGVLLTVLLPTITPSLNASAWGRDGYPHPGTLYMGDLRPDLFCGILMCCAIAVLVECARSLNRQVLLVSGFLAAASMLCKPSTLPGLVFIWTLAALCVLAINYKSVLHTSILFSWALTPLVSIVGLYLWKGGYAHLTGYLNIILVKTTSTWTVEATTFSASLKYYGTYFVAHMGLEGCVVLLLGGLSFILYTASRRRVELSLVIYLGLAIAWYLLVARTPAKNPFLALWSYLLAWLFSLISLALLFKSLESKIHGVVLPVLTAVFGATVLVSGFRFLAISKTEPIASALQNRAAIQSAARDLMSVIRAGEIYTAADWYGATGGALPYYTISPPDSTAYPLIWDPSDSPENIQSFLDTRVSGTKVIYTFKEDMAEVCRYYFAALPVAYPYYRSLAHWVDQPGHRYNLTKEYVLSFDGHPVTIQMYVHE